MKTILVPTDFSKNAYCALHYATQLFAEEQCSFVIVHSFENQVTNLTSRIDIGKTEAVVDQLYTTNERKCDEVKHQIILDTNNTKHTFKTMATSLLLTRAINKLIVKEKADFVVMGSQGATGAASILIGSNTLSMIKKIKKAPLLIVPKQIDFTPIKKIAFITGFKRSYTHKELEPLLTIAEKQEANVKVAHIQDQEKMNENQHENLHSLFDILSPLKPELHWLKGTTAKFETIHSYLNKNDFDMLVMTYYKHNFFAALFRESVVKNIAEDTTLPFLVLTV